MMKVERLARNEVMNKIITNDLDDIFIVFYKDDFAGYRYVIDELRNTSVRNLHLEDAIFLKITKEDQIMQKPNDCFACDKHGEDPTCHSWCEGYLKQRAWQDHINQRRKEEKMKYPIKVKNTSPYFVRNKMSIGELR